MNDERPTAGAPGWRAMRPDDLAAVDAVAARVHPDFPEDAAVFAERLRLYPQGCRVLAAADGEVVGYVVSHPWHGGQPPALNVLIGSIPAPASTYYIHDLALRPEVRGSGAASRIVDALIGHARTRGLTSLSLTAVNGSVAFWRKQGFVVVAPRVDGTMSSYGEDARQMRLDLA
ncbi:N-acetyltransferase [Bradyrhizobium sp. SSBR45G]|uniref:GNAT family N-acetyltransferase n=1 Tax=unclassified Bradyrhizobium TaxID=2631580 RepID=UPI0023429886|nr:MULTISPECIES: GNAT family N-acetyltransferase [unclassified Bradyrhizobium]GLH80639.1 N-acetyltransferase [Bradyrhizobium sp. SSBR45G]GLH85845.1 N-acetyltransferase [Bradyrhizobium sp. SSBR45R]